MPDLALHHQDLVACHDCDLLQRLPPQPPRGRLRCVRCGALLHEHGHDIVQAPLALAVAALVLFLLANSFPLLEFRFEGRTTTAFLFGGIRELYLQGMPILATTVLIVILVSPALHIGLLMYVYGPLTLGRQPPAFPGALQLIQAVIPWSMLEIFLLGVIVASVKLAERASIVPGPAAWALAALAVVLAAAATQVHPGRLWERVA